MEKTVLSKEEINQLSSLQQQQDNFVIQLGQVEYQINQLEQQKKDIKQNIRNFEKNQFELGNQLQGKYGQGTVNLESGEFIKS
jgi:predicted phage-related endonuclease